MFEYFSTVLSKDEASSNAYFIQQHYTIWVNFMIMYLINSYC